MPNFKEFIKGFEEKPEAKNPNPAPTPKPQEVKMEEPKPKKTVGEDLQEMYEKEFFKQANGNKEDFVNHFINRFGVPKGSSKKREAEFYGKRFDEMSANQPKPKFQDELEGIVQGMKEDEQKEYDERFLNDATMHLTEGLSPEEKAEVNKRFKALLDKEGFENITPETRYKEGSFEQAFGENEPRMLYVVYDTPQGKVGDYIELDPDMSEDDIIDQLKENENVVGVYGGATNAGAFDPKWVRE